MNKQRKTSHILNVFQYDHTTGAVTLPAGLSLPTPDSTDNSTKVATTAWIRAYVGSLSYATASSVETAIANLVASAPTTLDTLNELATALGNDPNFATTITTSIGTKVPQSRTITINGTAYDLSADRAWTIASGVTSFNTRTGAITLTSGDVTGALGYTPYNATNPSGYITGITSGMVTGALGYTPYNSSNPSGYITSSALTSYLPLSGGTMTGQIVGPSVNTGVYGGLIQIREQGYVSNGQSAWDYAPAITFHWGNRFATKVGCDSAGYLAIDNVRFLNASNYSSYALPLSGGTLTGTTSVNAGYSFVANGYNNNGGFAMNNGGQYWGLMWNMATNDWRLGRGSQTAQNGWNLRWDSGDNVFINQHLYLNNNYGSTIVGAYSSTVYQGIFAMGDAYKLPLNGSSTGSLYGLAWSHPNAGGVASNLNTHGLLVMENGTFLAAISGSIRARDDMRAPAIYDSGSRVAISRGEGRQYVEYSRYVYNNGAYSGSGWGEASDLGVRYAASANYASSAGSASSASHLPTAYAGGVQSNPQVYFNYGIGLKVAMTGHWSVWSDTLWVNGYSGGDVPWMCALHFLRNSEPRFAISAQQRDSGSYGSIYEVITSYNIANQTVSTANNLSGFDKTNPSFGAVYANNWFRAYGDTGLYTQDYGGHFRRNTYSYGNWEIFGYAKNGYTGIVTINNYVTAQMHNSSGDFGFLTENGRWWNLFYNNGNNCWGIGTDNTYSGDGFRCIKYGSAEYGWTTWSDRRAKENISTITGALDTVLAMRGVYFNYIKDEAKNKRVGFIAQELEQVLPEAVRYAEEIDEYSVEYAQIVSVLAEAIKEQDVKMKAQDAKITRLEALVEQLTNN
jgi:hypothetical protein